jgi:hypothetical protein
VGGVFLFLCFCLSVCGYTLTLRSLSKSTRVLTWTRTSRERRASQTQIHAFIPLDGNQSINHHVGASRRRGPTDRRHTASFVGAFAFVVRRSSRSRRRVPVPGKRLKSTDALNSRGERLGGATSKKRSSRLFVRGTRAFGVRRIGRDSGSGFGSAGDARPVATLG